MNNLILGYLALASIVSGIVFTALAKRHPVHIVGLCFMAMGFAEGVRIDNQLPSYTWLSLGAIVTGFGGAWCDRRNKKKEAANE